MLDGLVSDLTQEQADWMPPGKANPIGSLYWHIVKYMDYIVHDWRMGQPSLRQRAGWEEKVVIALPLPDPDDPMMDLRVIREGVRLDLPALHEYARATGRAALDWVASLAPEDLERTISTPIGDQTLGQVMEIIVIGHFNCHSGEISALRGCQGHQGYPW